MKNNQDQEDEKSNPSHKPDVLESITGEGKLWVRLKVPRVEQGGVSPKEEKGKMNDSSCNMKRVCRICDKAFDSGRALGGHMRIHFQEAKAKNKGVVSNKINLKAHQTTKFKKRNPSEGREMEFVEEKKQCKDKTSDHYGGLCATGERTCTECGKDFPSFKSLCGHLRWHPHRDWRGFPRRPSTVKKSSSPDPQPSREPAHQEKMEDLASGKGEKASMTEFFSGWAVTARRGRQALAAESASEFSSSEGHFTRKAVDLIMLMGRGNSSGSGSSSHSPKVDAISEAANSNVPISKANGLIKNKNTRKKMKLSDVKPAQKVQEKAAAVTDATPPWRPDHKYRCSICGESFASHQALGGHKSSHKKFKMVIENSDGKPGNPSKPVTRVGGKMGKGGNLEEAKHHYCKVCSKDFGTARGLASHVRVHGSASMEDPASQVAPPGGDTSGKRSERKLDVDLNEVPLPEDK